MKPWQFGKPKTPGFGISKSAYLSVLAGKPTLPPVAALMNPKGEGGAVEGFGVPLAEGATKEDLLKPMRRGLYALSSKDRKTVMLLTIVPKEESGFDPEALNRTRLAHDLPTEVLSRIRATWSLGQLNFQSHDAMVYPAVDLWLRLARRLGELTEGVVADPIAQRYLLPDDPQLTPRGTAPIDARTVVALHEEATPTGGYLFTLGMSKFGLPEYEMSAILPAVLGVAHRFLYGLCQANLMGKLAEPGTVVGARPAPIQVAMGGLDRSRWEGIPCLELIPARGSLTDALKAWESENP